jgi:DNA-binding NarL/FixJ family response regulator
LADDHTLLLEAFCRLLEPDCDVVGTVADGRALVEAAIRLAPDIVVLDVAMPQLNGLEAARKIKKARPHIKVVFLTVCDDKELVAETIELGASGYLLKTSAASELSMAIQEALAGRIYVTPQVNQGVLTSLRESRTRKAPAKLTARQRQILQHLAEGQGMKEIAAELAITTRTVAYHKYKLMRDHGLKSSADLVRFAIKHHIVTP